MNNEKNMDSVVTVTKTSLPNIDRFYNYLTKIWETRWVTNNGELAQQLERNLKEYLNIEHLLVVANGTLALLIALEALDVTGEVITTPFTFAATTNVLIRRGLTPVFADIDPETLNIDPDDVERKITDRTGAILAVHVYGNPCYVEEIEKIADKYNLALIYDGAHAFGVEYKNQPVFRFGDITSLSFHATKVYHSIEGGALAFRDHNLLEKLSLLRNHGIKSETEVLVAGTNAKMSEFHAAMGLCNLELIDEHIALRKKTCNFYKSELSKFKDTSFQDIIASKYNYIYFPVLFRDMAQRDVIHSALASENIYARKYFYPLTAHYSYFESRWKIPHEEAPLTVATDIAGRVLCLPLYPDLELDVAEKIVHIIEAHIG